jgi:ABC-type sugar transport system substrate-binding protein
MSGTLNISLCLPDEKNDYQQILVRDATGAANEAGLDIQVHFSESQILRQIEQIYNCIQNKSVPNTKAIIVMPVRDNKLDLVARDAVKSGIGWICISRRMSCLEQLKQEYPEVPISFIGPNQYQIGQIQGKQIRAMLPKGGRVMYVHGTAMTYSTRERLKGMEDEIKGVGIEVDLLDGDWKEEVAEATVSRWIRMRRISQLKIDMIACQNDVMAIGAKRAIDTLQRELDLPELTAIPVVGVDGTPNVGVKLVDEGKLTATIVVPSSGAIAVNFIARYLKTNEPVPAQALLEPLSYPSEKALIELQKKS